MCNFIKCIGWGHGDIDILYSGFRSTKVMWIEDLLNQ